MWILAAAGSQPITSFFSVQALAALVTLTILEVVLGIDNIIFISVLADRLPAQQQAAEANIPKLASNRKSSLSKMRAHIVRYRPDRTDGLSINVKRNQECFLDRRRHGQEIRVAPLDVAEKQRSIAVENVAARAEVARRPAADIRLPALQDFLCSVFAADAAAKRKIF